MIASRTNRLDPPESRAVTARDSFSVRHDSARRGFTHEAFDAFLAAGRSRSWLRSAPRGLAKLRGMALPDRRQEEWMRTDIRGFRFGWIALRWRTSGRSPPAALPPFPQRC